METITYSQIQEMVLHLPATKLTTAYRLLVELIGKEYSPSHVQDDFLKLSLEDRRKIMEEQANQLCAHYLDSQSDREAWQAGDFVDEN